MYILTHLRDIVKKYIKKCVVNNVDSRVASSRLPTT